ncbi:glycosyltransferase family 2 protein [Candidatus Stoquefichus massiliensis]|uniref:glycosyltransferase family 2 protein n=1 Tax=Candidatus Stoquefichus massiliensis TaxID=1470350 RepID=UPI0004B2DF82|nr:glycosyltransferase family 2 protein [Candidatus Stoquefichus massiliensis]
MDEILVTIIVPVYNAEKFLDRCILSIIKQTYRNIEILLIDDGSTDMSSLICDKWATKDTRIKVIHKKNQGLGYARNTGIENASGEYLCFCDADDRVDINTIKCCLEAICETSADIVNFGINYIGPNNKITKITKPLQYKIFEKNEIEKIFLPRLMNVDPIDGKDYGYCMSMCASMFSINLIKRANWRLVSEREIISEDFYSLIYLYKHVEKVVTIPQAFYYYYYNNNSLTHVFREDRLEKNTFFYQCTQKALAELNYNSDVMNSFNNLYLGNCIAALKQIVASHYKFNKKFDILKKEIKNETLLKAIKICKLSSPFQRKVLYYFIEKKMTLVCYVLLKIKS